MEVNYGLFPDEILCSVLSLLSLRQKLGCETVCQHWKQLLRGQCHNQAQRPDPCTWGRCVSIEATGPHDNCAPVKLHKKNDQFPQISIFARDASQTASEKAFSQWFQRVAPSLQRVSVGLNAYDNGWKGAWFLPKILAAVYLANQRNIAGPELELQAGQTCSKVTVFTLKLVMLLALADAVTSVCLVCRLGLGSSVPACSQDVGATAYRVVILW